MRINYSTKLKYNFKDLLPGTSAELAAVVTDETGSPGSLVFSENPTLQGVTVDGLFYLGDTTIPTGDSVQMLGGMVSTNTASGTSFIIRKSNNGANTPSVLFAKSRGTNASPSAVTSADGCGSFIYSGYDGSNYKNIAVVSAIVDGPVSSGVVPGALIFWTTSTSGTLIERARIDSGGSVTLGGFYTAPALKVTPVASQARRIEITGATSSGNPTLGVSGGKLAISSQIILSQTTLVETSVALTNGAAAAAGTLLNAPAAGNPTKWIPINDNGTTRYIPAW